jgi:hypothetical protein
MAILTSRDERERALMSLETLLSEEHVSAAISTSDLAAKAGISEEQAILAFHWMVENAFANGHVQNRGQIKITVKGRDECARLRLPKWKRWWYTESVRQPLIISVVAGLISGVIGGLIVKLLVK